MLLEDANAKELAAETPQQHIIHFKIRTFSYDSTAATRLGQLHKILTEERRASLQLVDASYMYMAFTKLLSDSQRTY
jgi:hypothetical protein